MIILTTSPDDRPIYEARDARGRVLARCATRQQAQAWIDATPAPVACETAWGLEELAAEMERLSRGGTER